VILDTKGNIFGGFTPLEWESHTSMFWKADESQKSFLYTLKNPHIISARRFVLKAEEIWRGIECYSHDGPSFGSDFGVSDNCNANNDSWTALTALTPTTPDCTRRSFSRVRGNSKSKKSKSSRLQPEQHFAQIFFFDGRGSEK
jgi:hypothetical protein